MLFGMVLLMTNLQPLIERMLLWVMLDIGIPQVITGILFWESKCMSKIIVKNIVAHKLRNKKTSTMFSFSIGFIVFLQSLLSVQIDGIAYKNIQYMGGDMNIVDTSGNGIHWSMIGELEDFLATCPDVRDWSWISHSLQNSVSGSAYANVGNLARLVEYSASIRGISPNFLAAQKGLATYSRKDPLFEQLGLSPDQGLYASPGNQTALVSSHLYPGLGVEDNVFQNITDPISGNLVSSYFSTLVYETAISHQPTNDYMYQLVAPVGFLDSAGYLLVTNFPTLTTSTSIVVSFPTFMDMSQGAYTSLQQIPMEALIIFTSPKISMRRYKTIYRQLQDILQSSYIPARVSNLVDEQQTNDSARNLIDVIFLAATALILVITIFSLNLSMMVNIWSQRQEIGVLRALGLTSWMIFRIYVYEAFVVVFASGLLGVSIE